MSLTARDLEETLTNATELLLKERTAAGVWEGELSSSALSTATATFALILHDPAHALAAGGFDWLAAHQNADGGWGDTVKSFSNISTTALCWAAYGAAGEGKSRYTATVARAEVWLTQHAGGIDPDHLVPAIIRRYGKDHTFSVPILTMCALAGRLGTGSEAWRRVPQLPFELAAFPQRWFKWLRLPVVSYALPALIAIGLVRHQSRRTRNPAALLARRFARDRALRLLEQIQPTSGGFLEATPLTSFVVMSLIGAGLRDHPVVRQGIDFLVRSARPDGSWPIDTNLSTWVTTLAVNALAIDPGFQARVSREERIKIRDWLLDQQYRTEHPYTLADAGGWAWTNLSGGVPDADDTPGALLALRSLGVEDPRTASAVEMGLRWLERLQNRDGGIPTFCRGWGKLPFDRSSADLTAHTLRAAHAWGRSLERLKRAIAFLRNQQREDGSWLPLWFGNQHAPDDENPTYGTARVMLAKDASSDPAWDESLRRGAAWLVAAQNPDGGWGGGRGTPSTLEETAIALEALARQDSVPEEVIDSGVGWLIEHTERGTRFNPSPIGFYFAKLWYFEKLYPLIFSVAALNAVRARDTRNRTAEAVHPA